MFLLKHYFKSFFCCHRAEKNGGMKKMAAFHLEIVYSCDIEVICGLVNENTDHVNFIFNIFFNCTSIGFAVFFFFIFIIIDNLGMDFAKKSYLHFKTINLLLTFFIKRVINYNYQP